MNVNTEEVISMSLRPTGGLINPLEFSEIETLTGIAVSAGKQIHDYIINAWCYLLKWLIKNFNFN